MLTTITNEIEDGIENIKIETVTENEDDEKMSNMITTIDLFVKIKENGNLQI